MSSPAEPGSHRERLERIARRVMQERGLCPDFSAAALGELRRIGGPAPANGGARDRRDLPWCSIDNDDTRDLDQLTAAESLPGGGAKVFVAVADVDALVHRQSALDGHARENTVSVYTVGGIFPMLPERLSTDLTSLGLDADRLAIVAEVAVGDEGRIQEARFYRALVRSRAKLGYPSVAAWLDGRGPVPPAVAAVKGLAENLKLQDQVAQRLRAARHSHGALDLQTVEAHAVFDGEELRDLAPTTQNRAEKLIEDLMIAANTATARFLSARGFAALRRVVRTPRHWARIVELAASRGATLPPQPDAVALERFLLSQKAADPVRFPDLSLSVVKLIGRGEYVLEEPQQASAGHFGLAIQDYTHSTAPNRRYPDVITQRLLKQAIGGGKPPYGRDELQALAERCTERQDAAKKVERQVEKSAAALLLEGRIGERFPALVTGASGKGTWARIAQPAVEGKVVAGLDSIKVGDCILAELAGVDVERGHIDFKAVGTSTACLAHGFDPASAR